jgi:hypothetical protein
MADAKQDGQREIDFRRAEQHALRDDARLPPGTDDSGKLVSEGTLKLVLVAVDSFPVPCWASADKIAERTQRWGRGVSRRTVISALQALVRLDIVAREIQRGGKSGKRVEYRVIWQNLRRFAQWRLGEPGTLSGPASQPSALGAQPGALGAQPGALGAQPGALECTLRRQNSTSEASQEAPSDVPTDGAKDFCWKSQRTRTRSGTRSPG